MEHAEAEPRILARPEHPISRKLIDGHALKVLYRLSGQGYKGYLVGGSVRDLMLERRPKDFDVATDAEPSDIRRCFRNARIIGRRFRLAHILFKEGVVEVATFRRTPDPEEQRSGPDDLLITDDNTWGTPREDAFRRDFTINALFYDIDDFSVIDYVGGIEDLRARLIRVIGDPDVRFREDPVRMMRACEFAGRLDFVIEDRTRQAIEDHREEISKASPSRLAEEVFQLLRSGNAGPAMQWMLELGLLEVFLPEGLAMLEAAHRGIGELGRILPTVDAMIGGGREIDDAVLLAALLLPRTMIERFHWEVEHGRWMPPKLYREVVDEVISDFAGRFNVPNLKKRGARRALDVFHRLCGRRKWTAEKRMQLARRHGFDQGLELFEIVAQATGQGHGVFSRWRAVQKRRGEMPPEKKPKGRRRRRGGRRRRGRGRGRGGGRGRS